MLVTPDNGPPLVSVDLHDQDALVAYYAGNDQRNKTLLTDPLIASPDIEVTVTFKKPLKWEAFVDLRDAVGLEVLQYTFAEIAPTGEKWALDLRVMPELSESELLAIGEREAEHAGVELLGVIVALTCPRLLVQTL